MKKYQPKYGGKPKKKALSVFSVCMLVFLVCAIGLSAFVWAKYISEEAKDTVVAAKSFYFESDLLSTDRPTYTLAPGTQSITIRLKNHADALRFSDVNISYKVTATGQTAKTGTLTGGKNSDVDITFDKLSAGSYIVTAEATSPYSKILSATFVIPAEAGNIQYSVSDAKNSPVLQVKVWSNDYSGNVKLSWPSAIYPDNTDPLLKNVTGTSVTLNFDSDSEYTFRFFKSSPATVYTKEQITAAKG